MISKRNDLPSRIKDASSVNSFKQRYDEYFFHTSNDKEWIENNRKTDKGDKIFKIGKNLIYNKNVMPLKKPKKNREPIFYNIHTYMH